ncbi:MAG: hypothetical protein ACE5OY_07240 [Candidatus Bathyarchaeia archaeon]
MGWIDPRARSLEPHTSFEEDLAKAPPSNGKPWAWAEHAEEPLRVLCPSQSFRDLQAVSMCLRGALIVVLTNQTMMRSRTKINVTIRGVGKETYQDFKAEAVRRGLSMGEAIAEALQLWVRKQREETQELPLEQDPLWKLLRHPADWGVETDASRVDEELYGLEGR